MYEDVLALLHKTNVSYENSNTNQYSIMRPIGSYARDLAYKALQVKAYFKIKVWRLLRIFTLEGTRLNRGEMKELSGERLSLCSPDELRDKTGCTPGCVAPFGYSHDVTIIVDNAIYTYDKILITPGVPEFTIELSTEELKRFY